MFNRCIAGFFCIVLCCQTTIGGIAASLPSDAAAARSDPAAHPDSTSVLSFGADPLGIGDSARAFQQAIGSAGRIIVPDGQYRFAAPVVLRSGVTISAESQKATLIADPVNAAPGGGMILVGTNIANVVITGLTFDGDVQEIANNHKRVVFINGADHVLFDRTVFRNAAGPALVFSGVADRPVVASGVRHSVFSNIGLAWRGRPTPRLADTASAVTFANGSAAANLGNFADDNDFTLIGSDAVDVHSQGHFTASGNHIALHEQGWRPTPATAVSYGVGGFYVYHMSDDVVLTGNYVEGATGNCFDIADSTRLTIKNNTVLDCGGAGVSLGNVHDFRITGNRITDTNRSKHYQVENTPHMGAISFACGGEHCTGSVADGVVSDNTLEHWDRRQTNQFGLWVQTGVTLSNLSIDRNVTTDGTLLPLSHESDDPNSGPHR